VSKQPRELINAIPGIDYRELKEASWCCGSAATFSLKYTSESQQILDRKLENIQETGAELLITANPGCHLQLAWGLKQAGLTQEVVHITELLGMATG
jgi:glycolate oxidase iron-sulfur subunit